MASQATLATLSDTLARRTLTPSTQAKVEEKNQEIDALKRSHQRALVILGQKIESKSSNRSRTPSACLLLCSPLTPRPCASFYPPGIETAATEKHSKADAAIEHAEKVATQFEEKDTQVKELRTLCESLTLERDELHVVVREFESKDEEQVRKRYCCAATRALWVLTPIFREPSIRL